ncbi:hypothetical protein QNI16_31010 [Cytophagaceae bacterium YF14B1]|uniref:Galactose oxidase n=1 Tax=Xanthocytophaga flava TaxID=3048013 RepID=A0AAE3QU30_9BACT|nr:hypothetical protein [Xanthocytophaga flavus]MDJ1484971.1 hypothetical protein [Xanthocytophaga flavus]
MKLKQLLFLFLGTSIFLFSCKKEDDVQSDSTSLTITTSAPTNISTRKASFQGEISFTSSSTVKLKEYGFVWSDTPNPTVAANKVVMGSELSEITSPFMLFGSVTELAMSTTYYVRGYAIAENGTVAYSSDATFQTLGGNNWETLTNFPGKMDQWALGFSIGDKIYVGNGLANETSSSFTTKEWWSYSITTDKWTQKADFPGANSSLATSFAIGNKGYIVTGGGDQTKACWEYSPDTDGWTKKAGFPGDDRVQAVSFVLNGKGYVCGGMLVNGANMLYDLWEFDPTNATAGTDANGNPLGKWTQKKSTPIQSIQQAMSFTLGTKGYVLADKNNTLGGRPLMEYDPAQNNWTIKSAVLPTNYVNKGFAFGLSDKAYAGGLPNESSYGTFWEYTLQTDAWTQKTNVPFYTGDGWTTTYNGRGYCLMLADFYEYIP